MERAGESRWSVFLPELLDDLSAEFFRDPQVRSRGDLKEQQFSLAHREEPCSEGLNKDSHGAFDLKTEPACLGPGQFVVEQCQGVRSRARPRKAQEMLLAGSQCRSRRIASEDLLGDVQDRKFIVFEENPDIEGVGRLTD